MEEREMYLVEHLEEFRRRIIVTLCAFILFFLLAFIFVRDIYYWLIKNLEFQLTILGPLDIVWVHIMLAGIVAIALSLPVFGFQVWAYVRPALKPHERKASITYVPLLFVLFVIGICFSYYIIFPQTLNFLISLNEGMFNNLFTVDRYFRFLFNMTLPIALLFDLPVVVMFLTSLGILNPYRLKKFRKYAYFILVVLATMITPPDMVSAIIITIPLILLFEISISLSIFTYKKKLKSEQEHYPESKVG